MLDFHTIKKITIFGSGVTANAVREKLKEFSEFSEVAPEDNPDLGILSPGLHTDEYQSKYHFPLLSEIDLAYQLFSYVGKLPYFITISGTNGKTTTTHLVADLLQIPLAGNVGIPLINYVSKDIKKIPNMFSLELSSYQIEQSPTFTPDIYILMNITPDHLDRHKTMENYGRIKLSLAKRQNTQQHFLYNGQDEWSLKLLKELLPLPTNLVDFQTKKDTFSNELRESPLLGAHNQDNLCAALCAVSLVGNGFSFLEKVKQIKNIPHRLEKLAPVNKITFINDSKGTNPDSTIAAINSVDCAHTILLLGGERKKVSYEPMFELIKNEKLRVITFGQDRSFFNDKLEGYSLLLGNAEKMSQATLLAYKLASPQDIVLLSPSCASFDEFKNFEERGNVFRELVSRISSEK